MALPVLNDVPKYVTELPSTGKQIKFRPFLVKEQKNLMIALESKDLDQIIIGMLDCIESCCQDIDAYKIPTYDADYLFAQVRAKSAGETAEVVTKCTSCEAPNNVKIDISSVKMVIKNPITKEIKLSENIILKLKAPTYNDMISAKAYDLELSSGERIVRSVICCFDSLLTDAENISFKDESREDVEKFVDSLATTQLDEIIEFTESLPVMVHEEPFICTSCKEDNTLRLEGLSDFFL